MSDRISLTFKKRCKPVSTSDPYGDLFDGGYIRPESMLDEQSSHAVRLAMATIQVFLSGAQERGLLEVT